MKLQLSDPDYKSNNVDLCTSPEDFLEITSLSQEEKYVYQEAACSLTDAGIL